MWQQWCGLLLSVLEQPVFSLQTYCCNKCLCVNFHRFRACCNSCKTNSKQLQIRLSPEISFHCLLLSFVYLHFFVFCYFWEHSLSMLQGLCSGTVSVCFPSVCLSVWSIAAQPVPSSKGTAAARYTTSQRSAAKLSSVTFTAAIEGYTQTCLVVVIACWCGDAC